MHVEEEEPFFVPLVNIAFLANIIRPEIQNIEHLAA